MLRSCIGLIRTGNLLRMAMSNPLMQQIRLMHDKDVLKLRCRYCYFKYVDERWYVFCNKHPRHKQRQKMSKQQQQDAMIVTHITRTGHYLKKHYQYPGHDL
uniref:Large ribosomal subunit protein bL36m n=1 Tax=Sarcoptes scabiei TaxID=52283 RepID=A0A834VDS8_SARSC